MNCHVGNSDWALRQQRCNIAAYVYRYSHLFETVDAGASCWQADCHRNRVWVNFCWENVTWSSRLGGAVKQQLVVHLEWQLLGAPERTVWYENNRNLRTWKVKARCLLMQRGSFHCAAKTFTDASLSLLCMERCRWSHPRWPDRVRRRNLLPDSFSPVTWPGRRVPVTWPEPVGLVAGLRPSGGASLLLRATLKSISVAASKNWPTLPARASGHKNAARFGRLRRRWRRWRPETAAARPAGPAHWRLGRVAGGCAGRALQELHPVKESECWSKNADLVSHAHGAQWEGGRWREPLQCSEESGGGERRAAAAGGTVVNRAAPPVEESLGDRVSSGFRPIPAMSCLITVVIWWNFYC